MPRSAARRMSRFGLLAMALLLPLLVQPQAARFTGAITLQVDATDMQRRILRVSTIIPVRPGRQALLYPQWLPGNHAPRGPIEQLAGLQVRAAGSVLAWKRDPLNVYRFEVDVPRGVRELAVEFQVATPQSADQGRVVMTAGVFGLQWNQVVLYPEGYPADAIPVRASLRLPDGWQHGSALRVAAAAGAPASAGWQQFEEVSLEVLVDSPLFAGRHFRRFDLAPAGGPPVTLNVVGDFAADIAASDEQIALHRTLMEQTYAALGPPRYEYYDFLLALSDSFGGIGLEHHRSSENTQSNTYFRAPGDNIGERDLLAHELVHAWNGKYRRPARLWTTDFHTPMQDDLLWVYEGLTQYYGLVLSARSGLWSPEFTRANFALIAAVFDGKRPGRSWRSLEDTTLQPIITPRRPLSWTSWQRSEDYYSEGAILWLHVDARLRELSNGQRTLDDFSRAFFAAPPNRGMVSTYEFADVVRALSAVAPFDWATFLRDRVSGSGQPVLDAFGQAGLELVYNDTPNQVIADSEKNNRRTDLSYSLGLVISRDGLLSEVVWGSPAFEAGLTTNTTLVAVNGRSWSADLLKSAITAARDAGGPIELLVRNQDLYRTVRIDYRGGLRYPHLVPVAGRQDHLTALLAPRPKM